jgi:hypothetical protein
MKNSFGQAILNNLLSVLSNKEFSNEVLLLQKKHNIPGKKISKKYLEEHENQFDDYYKDLEKLRVKFGLNEHYGIILFYVMGFITMPDDDFLEKLKPFKMINCVDDDGLKCAAIRIYPETTKKDIYENWPIIEKFQKETYKIKTKVKKPQKNSLRDLMIASMKIHGDSNKKIASAVNKNFPELETIGSVDIPKIISKNKNKFSRIINKI